MANLTISTSNPADSSVGAYPSNFTTPWNRNRPLAISQPPTSGGRGYGSWRSQISGGGQIHHTVHFQPGEVATGSDASAVFPKRLLCHKLIDDYAITVEELDAVLVAIGQALAPVSDATEHVVYTGAPMDSRSASFLQSIVGAKVPGSSGLLVWEDED